jgi:hypothetical protein
MIARHIGYCALAVALAPALLAVGCSRGVEDLVARPAAEKANKAASNQPLAPPPAPPPPPMTVDRPVAPEADMVGQQSEPLVDPGTVPPGAGPLEQPAARPSVPPAAKPQAPSPGGPSPAQPSIRLSAGVALAQTLPTGTAMSFSVDYEFTRGGPNPRSAYVWVIEPAKGQPAKFVTRLGSKGTLPGFVLKWRPENGPFQTHIEDAGGNQLSPTIPLR